MKTPIDPPSPPSVENASPDDVTAGCALKLFYRMKTPKATKPKSPESQLHPHPGHMASTVDQKLGEQSPDKLGAPHDRVMVNTTPPTNPAPPSPPPTPLGRAADRFAGLPLGHAQAPLNVAYHLDGMGHATNAFTRSVHGLLACMTALVWLQALVRARRPP